MYTSFPLLPLLFLLLALLVVEEANAFILDPSGDPSGDPSEDPLEDPLAFFTFGELTEQEKIVLRGSLFAVGISFLQVSYSSSYSCSCSCSCSSISILSSLRFVP